MPARSCRASSWRYCPPDARIVDTAPLSLEAIEAEFEQAHAQGQDVARLHSGDLSIWSALGEQLRRLDERGIPYTLTPGVPAFAAAAAALGRELTLPEVAQSVVLTRTSGRASSMPARETLATFAAVRRDAGHPSLDPRARQVVAELTPHYGADCPVAIVYRASLAGRARRARHARRHRGHRRRSPMERTALILVGPRAGQLRISRDSALYDADYPRRFRTPGWRGGQD